MQPDFLSLLERAGAARGLPTLAPSLRCLTCSGRRGPSWWCWEGGICSCLAARREGCPPLRGDEGSGPARFVCHPASQAVVCGTVQGDTRVSSEET